MENDKTKGKKPVAAGNKKDEKTGDDKNKPKADTQLKGKAKETEGEKRFKEGLANNSDTDE